jgi:hypothetical protein
MRTANSTLDAVMADDRAWFAANPTRRWRVRHFFDDVSLLRTSVGTIWAPAADMVHASTDRAFTRIVSRHVRPIGEVER